MVGLGADSDENDLCCMHHTGNPRPPTAVLIRFWIGGAPRDVPG